MSHLAMSEDLAEGQPGPVTEWGEHLTNARMARSPCPVIAGGAPAPAGHPPHTHNEGETTRRCPTLTR